MPSQKYLTNLKNSAEIAMLFLLIVAFPNDLFADGKSKKEITKITYNANVFEMQAQTNDTIYVENVETYEREMRIAISEPIPLKMNTEKIYQEEQLNQKVEHTESAEDLLVQFFKDNSNVFSLLEKGGYELVLKGVVIGKDGKVKFYNPKILSHNFDLENPSRSSSWVNKPLMPSEINTKLEKLFEAYLLGLQFTPAMLNGQKVISLTRFFGYQNSLKIIVENNYARLDSEPKIIQFQLSK